MKNKKFKKIIAGILSVVAVSSSGAFAMHKKGKPHRHHQSRSQKQAAQKIQGITYRVTKEDIKDNLVPTSFEQLRNFRYNGHPVTCIVFPDLPFCKSRVIEIERSIVHDDDSLRLMRGKNRVCKSKTDGIEFVFEELSHQEFSDRLTQMDENQRDAYTDDLLKTLSGMIGMDTDTVGNFVDVMADIIPDDFFDDYDD